MKQVLELNQYNIVRVKPFLFFDKSNKNPHLHSTQLLQGEVPMHYITYKLTGHTNLTDQYPKA